MAAALGVAACATGTNEPPNDVGLAGGSDGAGAHAEPPTHGGQAPNGAGKAGGAPDGSGGVASDAPGGAGGTGGTSTSSTSSASAAVATTGGGTVPCHLQPDFLTCANCFTAANPTGAQIYSVLALCVYCSECWSVCNAAASIGCGAPPAPGACDGTSTICGDTFSGCVACAVAGTCASDYAACNASGACLQFSLSLQSCPPP
jgi:hypothetical protein